MLCSCNFHPTANKPTILETHYSDYAAACRTKEGMLAIVDVDKVPHLFGSLEYAGGH